MFGLLEKQRRGSVAEARERVVEDEAGEGTGWGLWSLKGAVSLGGVERGGGPDLAQPSPGAHLLLEPSLHLAPAFPLASCSSLWPLALPSGLVSFPSHVTESGSSVLHSPLPRLLPLTSPQSFDHQDCLLLPASLLTLSPPATLALPRAHTHSQLPSSLRPGLPASSLSPPAHPYPQFTL